MFALPVQDSQWTVIVSWSSWMDVESATVFFLFCFSMTGFEVSESDCVVVSTLSLVEIFEFLKCLTLNSFQCYYFRPEMHTALDMNPKLNSDYIVWILNSFGSIHPLTLVSLLSSSSKVLPVRAEWPAVCVPCVALPPITQGRDPGMLTAGSPAVPCDQQSFAVLCLTATMGASVDTDRLFWTEIPPSHCQTKQTLP